MKRFTKLFMTLVLSIAISFTGCTSQNEESGTQDIINIGIMQFVDHPSLNEIRESFITKLKELGYDDTKVKINYQNGNGDFSNLNSIAQKFVGEEMDLIVAIATPSAQAAAAATQDIPILFSAVSDPVDAGLLKDNDKPDMNITGTSDVIDVESIFELSKLLTPDVKKFGFIYNSGESNSQSVIKEAKSYLDTIGVDYTEATVTNSSEVQQTALQLLSESDAIFAPIDNTIASTMPILSSLAIEQNKPVYVAADSMVKDGGLATVGVNYTYLGEETAIMAKEILDGKSISEIPVRRMDKYVKVINKKTADQLGVDFSQQDDLQIIDGE